MVKLTTRWQTPQPLTLKSAIQRHLKTHQRSLREKGLQIEIDLGADEGRCPCPHGVQAALEHLLKLAILRSPKYGELQITACTTSRGLEIEVADSSDESDFPRFNAFKSQECSRLIDCPQTSRDVRLFAATCPQGGMAWTIIIKARVAQLRVA